MTATSFSASGYDIIRRLGSGGTAEVFLASKISDGKLHALKIPLDANPDSLPRFLSLIRREYQLIGRLNYPGLVRVIDIAEDAHPFPWLALEYCPGITLDTVGKINSVKTLLNILSSICINLYYLELLEIYHGDLKPQNIFLNNGIRDFSGGRLIYTKISDFSLALKQGEVADSRLGIGTIGYMAPETIDTNVLNQQSAIFALGTIAYQLATGKHPFMENDKDPVRVNAATKETKPIPICEVDESLPRNLSDLIDSMMEKNPVKRLPNAFLACALLEKIGADYPFRMMIRPKHLLQVFGESSSDAILKKAVFSFESGVIEKLLDHCGDDNTQLRNTLEVNFTMNHLLWKDGKLSFGCDPDDLVLPSRISRNNRTAFHRLPYSRKKRIVQTAICGNPDKAQSIGIIGKGDQEPCMTRPVLCYLRDNLSPVTIRRVADRLAYQAINISDQSIIAAELYLEAGNLERGYTIALDAANDLINKSLYDDAFTLLRALENLSREKRDIEKLKTTLMLIGDTEKMIGNSIGAEKSYKAIIPLYNEGEADNLLAEVFKDLGDLYRIKQDFDAGIKALEEAERIYSRLNNPLELSHTLNNMGNIYIKSNQMGKAFSTYRRALVIQRKLDITEDIASTLGNMAVIYYYRGRAGRTMRLMNLALALQRKTGNAMEIARTLNNLGFIYYEQGKFDRALDYLRESQALNKRIGIKKELLYNFDNLTNVMLSAGRLKEGLKFLREGMDLANEISDFPHMAYFTLSMGIAQKQMGLYGQAIANIRKAAESNHQVEDEEHTKRYLYHLADFYLRVNDKNSTRAAAEEIHKKAQKDNDKKLLIYYYLIKGLIDNDIELLHKAAAVAEEINARREKNVALLRLARILVLNGRNDEAAPIIESLGKVFVEGNSDIENAGFGNLCGVYHLAVNDVAKAQAFFEKSLRLSGEIGLLPEMAEALTNLGHIFVKQKEYEVGYQYYRKAINAVKSIADDIEDEELRKSFLSDEKIASLAGEVKKLSQFLAQKKKAGS